MLQHKLQLYVAAPHAALFNKHHPSFLFPVHLLQTLIMLSPTNPPTSPLLKEDREPAKAP